MFPALKVAVTLIATTIERFGRIDLLVNNAGICGSQPFEDATLLDFDHYWRVHVAGAVNTVKAAWPHFVAQRHGKIILVTSVTACLVCVAKPPTRQPSAK
jgi:NAD(P)-dependent dehydrogenase (short-subunit alcohol dehydrogenase family)